MIEATVILVNYNTVNLLNKAITHIEQASRTVNTKIIVIDNNSTDGSKLWLKQNESRFLAIYNEKNIGFGRANNIALNYIEGEYLLLVNTDAFIAENSIKESIKFLEKTPECGIVGINIVSGDGSPQASARNFITPINLFLTRTGIIKYFPSYAIDPSPSSLYISRECDWITGCFLMIRKSLVEKIGLFDERFFLYCEELDLCKRAKAAGNKIYHITTANVIHLGGESSKNDIKISDSPKQISELQIESEILYFRKHYGYAGLFLHSILSIVGDFLLILYSSFKRRSYLSITVNHLGLTINKLISTNFGRKPTR